MTGAERPGRGPTTADETGSAGGDEGSWAPAPVRRGVGDGWHAGLVRGPARIAGLCSLCVVVLAVTSLALILVATAVAELRGAADGQAGEAFELATVWLVYLPFVWLVAIVPVALVGWPAGLGLAWLLRRRAREVEHVVAFAVVGAVLAPLLLQSQGGLWAGHLGAAAVAMVEGAVGAGGGRWWTGVVLRRRAARGELPDRPAVVPPRPRW